jgi:hypothetical protein
VSDLVPDAELEEQIDQWRSYLRRRRAMDDRDVEELEAHLRDQIGVLRESGLAADEAFLVAIRRLGALDVLSREFAREHSARLWKQSVIARDLSSGASAASHRDTLFTCCMAVAAAIAIKLPALFGVGIEERNAPFYARNASVLVLPWLAAWLARKRDMALRDALWLGVPWVAAAMAVNGYPFDRGGHISQTGMLAALHLPIALWLAIGVAYTGGHWFAGSGRMDFVRFSGELFIHVVLIALGGLLLTAFTMMMFGAINVRAEWLARDWLVPCGAAGALLVAAWLVEARQGVIENMAPVLTRLFTPLFTLLLLAFLATVVWTGRPVDVQREVLIAADLLLALVLGLVLYSASARDAEAPPNLFDALQVLLIASALAVDVVLLAAIAARISSFGFTPNRVTALGANLLLLANLAGSARHYIRFMRGRAPFRALETWQVAFLPVFSLWAAIVVALFPPLFRFL